MEKRTVNIPAISCGHCIMTIKRELGGLKGVSSLEGDEKTRTLTIKWENPATWEKIADTLKELGYPAVEEW
jgi:copper chaperone CopZ